MSVHSINDAGCVPSFVSGSGEISSQGDVIMEVKDQGNLYNTNVKFKEAEAILINSNDNSAENLWHAKYGYLKIILT